MNIQQDIYLKFTQKGAEEFLDKVEQKMPEFYKKNGKAFPNTTPRKRWMAIDEFLSEKNIKNIKKLFYDEIYLFYKHGSEKHSGEVLLENLANTITTFFSEEEQKLLQAAENNIIENEDINIKVEYGTYGVLIRKSQTKTSNEKPKEKLQKDIEIPSKITESKWSLYSFWEENHHNDQREPTGKKNLGIIQSLVEMQGNQIAIHYMNKFGQIELFEGELTAFEYEKQTYVETNLMMLSDQRRIRIMLLFGEQIDNLAMCIFYNIRSEGALFAGSGLLVREEANAKFLVENKKSIVHKTIDNKVISHFFERRSQNYLKLPRIKNYSLDKLYEKLMDLLKKGVEKDIRICKHDFFISIPMSYVNNSRTEFDKNKKYCLEIIKNFEEKLGLTKYYFACERYDFNDYETMMLGTHYEDAMEGVAESKIFILAIPNMEFPSHDSDLSAVRFSSVWTELGYAIGLKKPIIILCDKDFEDKLPNIVQNLNKQILVAKPDMTSIKSMKAWFRLEANILGIQKFLDDKNILDSKSSFNP